jgi:hypothetical protein
MRVGVAGVSAEHFAETLEKEIAPQQISITRHANLWRGFAQQPGKAQNRGEALRGFVERALLT